MTVGRYPPGALGNRWRNQDANDEDCNEANHTLVAGGLHTSTNARGALSAVEGQASGLSQRPRRAACPSRIRRLDAAA
jgi:hypothetical protein